MRAFAPALSILLACGVAASGARAGEDAGLLMLEPAFTGTIVSVYPDGRSSRLWINRDGTFALDGRAHERQAGRWRLKGRAVCFSQLKPVPIPFVSYCAPMPPQDTSGSWSGKAVTGEAVTIHLVKDRSSEPAA